MKTLAERFNVNESADKTAKLYQLYEDNLHYLASTLNIGRHTVDMHKAFVHRYSFYGYLTSINVPKKLHYLTMRVNGMFTPLEFDESIKTLIIPDDTVVERLIKLHNTKRTSLNY